MIKTLMYRLFRLGGLPRSERLELQKEGLQYLDEGIPLTIGWRRYREANRYIAQHRRSLTGTVALTRRRLLLFSAARPLLALDLKDPRVEKLKMTHPTDGTLALSLNAEDFHPGCSGQITYWLSTAGAQALLNLWHSRPAFPADSGPAPCPSCSSNSP